MAINCVRCDLKRGFDTEPNYLRLDESATTPHTTRRVECPLGEQAFGTGRLGAEATDRLGFGLKRIEHG